MKRTAPLRRTGFGRRGDAGSRAWAEAECKTCGDKFTGRCRDGIKPSYCSTTCAAEGARRRAKATYPPRDEVVRLYVDEGLTDRELGRRFGHTYQWALGVRKHYGIPGRPRGSKGSTNHKPLHKQRDRARFHIGLKSEPACRHCGAEGVVLHLHHAVPRSISPAGRFDLRNGVVLCARCHFTWHAGTPLPREMFTETEWSFIETLIGPGWLARRYPRRREIPAIRTCQRGHPFDEENTMVSADGKRRCRACDNLRHRVEWKNRSMTHQIPEEDGR